MSWRKLPLDAADWLPPGSNPLPFAGLLSSLPGEHDYACEVKGDLPVLTGTLYRIGPGLYDRGPDRKRMMLDGDGMVQALSFRDGVVRYRNRYVATDKYREEAAAGRFVYPTFSCHGSGPFWRNLGISLPNQANTTVIGWAGRLFAFDEGQRPYELDAALDTLGEATLDPEQARLKYWAHCKVDAIHRQLHCLSMDPGRRTTARIVSLSGDGQVAGRRALPLPRSVYIHDWFVTASHFAFLLHPAFIDPAAMLKVLVARETFSEAIQWRPERGGVLVVVHRDTGEVHTIDTPACWMWHAINAFEDDDTLVLDFIGAELGGGLGSDASPLFQVMRGEQPSGLDEASNFPRRYRINLRRASLTEQVIDAAANFELPNVSATECARPHSWAYMTRAAPGELFASGIARVRGDSLETQHFDFGAGQYCGEPVFLDDPNGPRGRYVATQVYCSAMRRSEFVIFDEATFTTGPVARIPLQHHVPLSFHGFWVGRGA